MFKFIICLNGCHDKLPVDWSQSLTSSSTCLVSWLGPTCMSDFSKPLWRCLSGFRDLLKVKHRILKNTSPQGNHPNHPTVLLNKDKLHSPDSSWRSVLLKNGDEKSPKMHLNFYTKQLAIVYLTSLGCHGCFLLEEI